MGGKTEIVQPSPPAAPTAGQSAAEYAKALPTILEAQLKYQPEFDRQQLQSFQELGPEFARVSRQVLESYAPTLASLDEELAKQALDLSQNGLTESAKNLYRDEFKALAGNQVTSGLGANFVSRNLVREQLAAQAQGQNLGLSLQGKVPISQAFQAPSNFNVAGGFGNAFSTDAGAFSSVYSGAGRPQQIQGPDILGGIGGILQGIGSFGSFRTK